MWASIPLPLQSPIERRSFPFVLLLSCAALAVGCGQSVDVEECEALLARYTEKQIDQSHPSTSSRDRSRIRQLVRAKSQLDPEFASCQDHVSRSQWECAMTAQSADQMERCLL